jgi:cation diffusion facilitator family transporter
MASGNRKAIFAALFANLGLAIAKFVGWLVTGASSMLAEGVHSVADSGNQALLLWGGAAAQREPTARHPFGFGRERYFWSFVVSVVIFTLGSLFALYEGIHKLGHAEPLSSPWVAITILLVGILLEGASLRTAVVEARPIKGARSWWSYIRQSKSPELPVVLLEDLGALVGLLIALLGVGLATLTGDGRWDAVGSISIGLLLGAIAVVLAIEMKSLLIGEAADPAAETAVREAIEAGEEVERIIHLRTLHLGPEHILVAVKIDFTGIDDFPGLAEAIDAVERRVRDAVVVRCTIYVEPDVYRERRSRAPAALGNAPVAT